MASVNQAIIRIHGHKEWVNMIIMDEETEQHEFVNLLAGDMIRFCETRQPDEPMSDQQFGLPDENPVFLLRMRQSAASLLLTIMRAEMDLLPADSRFRIWRPRWRVEVERLLEALQRYTEWEAQFVAFHRKRLPSQDKAYDWTRLNEKFLAHWLTINQHQA